MKPLPKLKWLLYMGGIYGVAAVVWSMAGFLTPVPPTPLHEYSLPSFFTEIGGHMLFGLVAALPSLDPALITLVVGESVLIDADHLFFLTGFPVEPRLAHSFTFAFFIAFALAYAGRRGARLDRGIFFATLGAVAGHFSYDIFAGYGLFPVFAPFSNSLISLPFSAWLPLEGAALALCLLTWFPRHKPGQAIAPGAPLSRTPAA